MQLFSFRRFVKKFKVVKELKMKNITYTNQEKAQCVLRIAEAE